MIPTPMIIYLLLSALFSKILTQQKKDKLTYCLQSIESLNFTFGFIDYV